MGFNIPERFFIMVDLPVLSQFTSHSGVHFEKKHTPGQKVPNG